MHTTAGMKVNMYTVSGRRRLSRSAMTAPASTITRHEADIARRSWRLAITSRPRRAIDRSRSSIAAARAVDGGDRHVDSRASASRSGALFASIEPTMSSEGTRLAARKRARSLRWLPPSSVTTTSRISTAVVRERSRRSGPMSITRRAVVAAMEIIAGVDVRSTP